MLYLMNDLTDEMTVRMEASLENLDGCRKTSNRLANCSVQRMMEVT